MASFFRWLADGGWGGKAMFAIGFRGLDFGQILPNLKDVLQCKQLGHWWYIGYISVFWVNVQFYPKNPKGGQKVLNVWLVPNFT